MLEEELAILDGTGRSAVALMARLLLVHEDVREPGQGGGAESLLRDQTEALRRLGHTVAWLHSGEIERAIEVFKPDIVQIQTIHNFIGLAPAVWLQEHKFPHVWAIMDYYPFCGNRMMLRNYDVGCSAVDGVCDGNCPSGRAHPGILEIVNRSPVVALNANTADIYRRNGLRCDFVVELGVDTETFRPDHSVRNGHLSVYTSSAWAAYPTKGMHTLKAALAGSEYEGRLLSGITRLQVAEELRKADVYVFPSAYEETWGICLTEGMASGAACIATDTAGAKAQLHPSQKDDARIGLLVPKRDARAMREALDYLAAHPGERAAMGARARAHVEADHSLEAMGRRWEAVYETVLSRDGV